MQKKEKKDFMNNFLYQDIKDEQIKKIIFGLYSYVNKIDNLLIDNTYNFKKNYMYKDKEIKSLDDLENEIYFVDDHYLNDNEKIKLELLFYKPFTDRDISERIKELSTYIKNKKKLNSMDIHYLKQKLVEIQILENSSITFYKDAYELFLNYYNIYKDKEKVKR